MSKLVKVSLLTILLMLILFSLIAELPILHGIQSVVGLKGYARMISLLGLAVVLVLVLVHRRRMEVSQKYRRADEIMAQAAAAARKQEVVTLQAEARVNSVLTQKEREFEARLEEAHADYQNQLRVLKEQNIALKETVGKLMRAIKESKTKAQP